MARTQNLYHQADPTAQVAGNLARALFGDPAAAAQQQAQAAELEQMQARTRASNAQADLYGVQAEGQGIQNTASQGLPAIFARMAPQQAIPAAPQPIGLNDWLSGSASLPNAQPAPAANDMLAGTPLADPPPAPPLPTGVEANLPAMLAAMAQMQGDKVDPRQIMGTYGAFMGGDKFARRGLIAQGHTPGENFAVTADRADAISARDASEAFTKDTAVARINHANDIPVANIRAGATMGSAAIRADASRDVAEIRESGGTPRGIRNNNPGNLEFGPFARQYGATSSDGRFAIFPDFESGVRAQEALLSGRSYIGGQANTIDKVISRYAPVSDGNHVGNYASFVSRVTGIPRNQVLSAEDVPAVAEAMRKFENGGNLGKGKPPKKADEAKAPTSAAIRLVNAEVDNQLGGGLLERISAKSVGVIRELALEEYRMTGNPSQAVRSVIMRLTKDGQRRIVAREGGNSAAPPASRPAAGGRSRGPVKVSTPGEAQKLAPGTRYVTPDGREFTR